MHSWLPETKTNATAGIGEKTVKHEKIEKQIKLPKVIEQNSTFCFATKTQPTYAIGFVLNALIQITRVRQNQVSLTAL